MMALITIQSRYSPTSIRPGKKAPANRSPTETGDGAKLPFAICTCALMPASMSPMKISTVEGGMIWPSVPEAQITPQARRGS